MRVLICFVVTFASLQTLDCLDTRALYSRLNFFDIDLLKYSAENKHGNVMVSPASIKSTLAMLLEGATGETADEIRSALRLSSVKDDLREQLNLYLKALHSNSTETVLENANAIFVSNKLRLKKDYETNLRYVYFSEAVPVNFGNNGVVAQQINAWVNGKTKGLIPSIVDQAQINAFTEMIVTNALYFKGSWMQAFNPKFTRPACFYNKGVCHNVAMMELQTDIQYAYVDNLRAHAVELPYAGKRYSMILLVPIERDGCAALIRDLPFMSLPQISDLLESTEVQLSLPKFTVDYNEDIIQALKSMRINALFSPSANLSGIFEGTTPYVSNLYHKVHMSVDEQGTVAAAASAAMVVPLINDGVELRVDRPFVFFIRDNKLGLVLFEGKIDEPTEYVEKPINYRVKTSRPFFGIF